MRKLVIAFLVLLLIPVATAQADTVQKPKSVLYSSNSLVVETYNYTTSNHPHQVLDASYNPMLSNAPWVVTIHGGSWSAGSRKNTAKVSAKLQAEGFQVFNVEYRLSTDYGSIKGCAWPCQRSDILSAIRWIKANADRFGIDPNRGALYGFSAGGHLAASVGYYDYTNASRMRAVVSVSGVLQPHRVQIVADSNPDTGFAGDYPNSVRKGLARWSAVVVRCPYLPNWTDCNNRWRDFMPQRHLDTASDSTTPILIVQGTNDEAIPNATITGFTYWLRRASVPHETIIVPGFGHNEAIVTENSERWREMVSFLNTYTR